LKNIDFSKYELIINYFTPLLTTVGGDEDENIKKVALNAQRNIMIERKLLHEIKIKNPVAIKSFQELFIEKMNEHDVFKRFYRDYNLKTKADINEMMNEKDNICYLKTWEYIGSGLYEIY